MVQCLSVFACKPGRFSYTPAGIWVIGREEFNRLLICCMYVLYLLLLVVFSFVFWLRLAATRAIPESATPDIT